MAPCPWLNVGHLRYLTVEIGLSEQTLNMLHQIPLDARSPNVYIGQCDPR